MDPTPPIESLDKPVENLTLKERIKRIPPKYLWFGVFVISLVSLGISFLILYSSKNKLRVPLVAFDEIQEELAQEQLIDESEPPVAVSEVSTPTPTFAPEATASWSAFQSFKYGYSFKYPPGWIAIRTAQSDPLILDYVVINPIGDASASAITMSYTSRSAQQSLAVYPQPGTPISVNGIPSVLKQLQNSEGVVSIQVVIPDAPNSVVFFAKQAYENVLAGILSTFTFL